MIANETPARGRGLENSAGPAGSVLNPPTTRAFSHDATERFIDALNASGSKITANGQDRWRATCPAHNGQDLNLSVAKGDQGVLIKCWSQNCSEQSIAHAVGLEMRDLFDSDGRAVYKYGNGYDIVRQRKASDFGSDKIIKPARAGITPEVRPLWTPEGSASIADSPTVLICEGEKTADALIRLGASCAATWPGGAQSVERVDLNPLEGRTVVIVPDNDQPGLEAASKLAKGLMGIAAAVRVWRVPAHLNDAADLWLEGGTLNDLNPDDADTSADNVEVESAADTWSEIPLDTLITDLLAGTVVTAQPTVLTRTDGQAVFYRGKTNGIHGDSGSGKSWTALYASAQLLADGEHVIYVDMEDSAVDVIGRLLALSVPAPQILNCFHYVQPEATFQTGADGFLGMVERLSPSMVVIDSTGESLSVEGKNPNADEEIAAWFREVPKRIAKHGPAVVILDHMPKSSDSDLWPIGSQRKRAAIDGAQYLQEVMTSFSKEKAGAAKLVCAKDRHGNYARGEKVAVLHVTPDSKLVRLVLEAPDVTVAATVWRPTRFMERISRALEDAPEPISFNGINERVQGKRELIRRAVDILIRDGHVTTTAGARNATLHTSAKPFREFTNEQEPVKASNDPQTTDDWFRSLEGEPVTSHLTESGNQSGTSGNQSSEGGFR